MTAPDDLGAHPRVAQLIERFRCLDAAMRDLPIYNDKVAIAAIGFHALGDGALLGVVLTPWFMNLVLLPVAREPMRAAEIGRSVPVELPAGRRNFLIGGDDVIGLYRAHSLHSPVLHFVLPGQAHAEARRLLALLLTSPAAQAVPPERSARPSLDRRAVLFGRGANTRV